MLLDMTLGQLRERADMATRKQLQYSSLMSQMPRTCSLRSVSQWFKRGRHEHAPPFSSPLLSFSLWSFVSGLGFGRAGAEEPVLFFPGGGVSAPGKISLHILGQEHQVSEIR